VSRNEFVFHDKPNDAISGEKVIIEARQITKPTIISARTHEHRGMRTIGRDAIAWVEKSFRYTEKRYSLK